MLQTTRRNEETTRSHILNAADGLFGELGFDATPTREIAERAGVNKALIHYHFKNKDGLLAALLENYYDELTRVISECLSGPGDIQARLSRLVDTYVDFLADNQNFCRIVQREAAGGRHAGLVQERTKPLFALGEATLHREFPSTKKGSLAAAQLMVSFYGMIITYFTFAESITPMVGGDPLSRKALEARKTHLKTMLELSLDALREGEAQ